MNDADGELSDPGDARHQAKVRNEKVKMRAGALNALGIALVGSAFVFPVIRDVNLGALLELRTWFWILMGGGLHQVGIALLGTLKRED